MRYAVNFYSDGINGRASDNDYVADDLMAKTNGFLFRTAAEKSRLDTMSRQNVDISSAGYQIALQAYENARKELIKVIQSAGLTAVQQRVLYLACTDYPQPSFKEIARRAGLKDEGAAWYHYKKGFVNVALHLQKKGII